MLQDMLQNEADYNFKMIPDIARDESNTRAFSQHEKCLDFVKNAKYNKKQAKTIREQIVKLNSGLTSLLQGHAAEKIRSTKATKEFQECRMA